MESNHEIFQERIHNPPNEGDAAQHLPPKTNVNTELNHAEA